MKKILLFTITLTLMTGISKAAKNEVPATTNASNTNNKAIAPVLSSSVSMAELIKENQNLKLALAKATAENENMNDQVCFAKSMFSTTIALHQVEMEKQEEKAKDQANYALMMHHVLMTLNTLPKNI